MGGDRTVAPVKMMLFLFGPPCLFLLAILGKNTKFEINLNLKVLELYLLNLEEGKTIANKYVEICFIWRHYVFSVSLEYFYCHLSLVIAYFSTCGESNIKRIVRKIE